jgi:Fe2+ transport system protein FeoA
MAKALSPEEALAEVKGYTGLDLTVGDIQSLYEILTVPRKDTAIISHLRKAEHQLSALQHLPDGENWWDKVHEDILAADDDAYVEEQPGTHKSPVPHDRNAVIFWLEHKILPALTGGAATPAASSDPGAEAHGHPNGPETSASGKPGASGQGPLADAKKRRALESYAMNSAAAYYRARGWDAEFVSDSKKVLDLRLVRHGSGEMRRVEVKGSSQAAIHVEVTRAEVAMSRKEACYLFVLDKIVYEDTGPGPDDYVCQGGRRRSGNWCADDEDLEPKTFDYHLAPDFGEADVS